MDFLSAGGLRAAGDRELAERLLADPDVKDAVEHGNTNAAPRPRESEDVAPSRHRG
jgi:hypothetical protein